MNGAIQVHTGSSYWLKPFILVPSCSKFVSLNEFYREDVPSCAKQTYPSSEDVLARHRSSSSWTRATQMRSFLLLPSMPRSKSGQWRGLSTFGSTLYPYLFETTVLHLPELQNRCTKTRPGVGKLPVSGPGAMTVKVSHKFSRRFVFFPILFREASTSS